MERQVHIHNSGNLIFCSCRIFAKKGPRETDGKWILKLLTLAKCHRCIVAKYMYHFNFNFASRLLFPESIEIYTWDQDSHGPNISILDDEPHIIRRDVAKQSTDGARGVHGVRTGRSVFKFQFNGKPWGSHCAVGVCTKRATLHYEGIGINSSSI